MRIHFTSQDRPKAIARKLRGLLKDAGSPVTQSRALEIVADLYGYPTWQELSSSIGTQAASPDDHDLPPEIVTIRREAQVQALCRHGFTISQASEAVLKLRPTGGNDSVPAGNSIMPRNEMVDHLLGRALSAKVSDIHFEPDSEVYSIYFRSEGLRELAHTGSISEYETIASDLKGRASMDLAERRVGQDGAFLMHHYGMSFELRIATVPTVRGEQIVVRILDPHRVRPTFESLGLFRVQRWRDAIRSKSGLCLIVQDEEDREIMQATIRDLERLGRKVYRSDHLVEYTIPYIGSVSTNPQPVLFPPRRLLRDSDAILMGDIKTEDDARTAFAAARNGHMVIATVREESLALAVDRLQSLGVSATELRTILRGVLVNRKQVSDRDLADALSSHDGTESESVVRTTPTQRELVALAVDVSRLMNHQDVLVSLPPLGIPTIGYGYATLDLSMDEHARFLASFVDDLGVSQLTKVPGEDIGALDIHHVRVQWSSDLRVLTLRVVKRTAADIEGKVDLDDQRKASLLSRNASPAMLDALTEGGVTRFGGAASRRSA